MSEAAIPQSQFVASAPEKFLPLERVSFFRRFWAGYSGAILTIGAMVVVGVLWEIEARYLELVPAFMIP